MLVTMSQARAALENRLQFTKRLNMELTADPTFPLPGTCSKEEKAYSLTETVYTQQQAHNSPTVKTTQMSIT